MRKLAQFGFPALLLLVATALLQTVACTGYINTPQPTTPAPPPLGDQACPVNIPDQDTTKCPRLKNIMLTCAGNGKIHLSLGGGGTAGPLIVGAKLDDGSNLSAVLVVVNCSDGPREGVTFGVTYTGQVSTPPTGPACISQSKAVYSQFQFGDPLYAGFEGMAKDQFHQVLDQQAINAFSTTAPAVPRCSFWREMP